MLSDAKKLVVIKGKKVSEFDLASGIGDEAVSAMLGPTGNLRAPTLKAGSTLLVGYNDEVFRQVFA